MAWELTVSLIKVAVIGSGISGLVCAQLLKDGQDVVIYEKESSIGIGAHGIDVPSANGQTIRIDFPHRVVNLRYYPNLVHYLQTLGVQFTKEDFAASVTDTQIGSIVRWSNFKFLGKQWPNFHLSSILSRPLMHISLLYSSVFFFSQVRKDLSTGVLANITLGEYFDQLKQKGYSYLLLDCILVPMLSIANTCSFDDVRAVPADIPMKYLTAGMFSLRARNTGYYRPIGGVTEIVRVLTTGLNNIKYNTAVTEVDITPSGKLVVIDSTGGKEEFDDIVLATQANHAAKLVGHLDHRYEHCLKQIKHVQTKLVLHTDPNLLPDNRNHWSTFNILVDRDIGQAMGSFVLNNTIPGLSTELYQTGNPIVEYKNVIAEHTFERPIMNLPTIAAVKQIQQFNGSNNIWFCGSYSNYGMPLLENGVESAFHVFESMTGNQAPRAPPHTYDQTSSLFSSLAIVGTIAACTAALYIWKGKKNNLNNHFKSLFEGKWSSLRL